MFTTQNNIQAVIFDCDGTLVDSEPITNDVLVDCVSEFGLHLDPAKALSLFIGRDMPGIIEVLNSQLAQPLPESFTDEFRERQAVALEQRLQPIEGARELLQSVELPMFLASNAPREKIDINLRVTGLDQFFSNNQIFSAYDIQAWKPLPDLFLHVAQAAGFDPAVCAVVEDSPAGIEAAARADMRVYCYSPESPMLLSEEVRGLPRVAEMRIAKRLSEMNAAFLK